MFRHLEYMSLNIFLVVMGCLESGVSIRAEIEIQTQTETAEIN